MAEIYAVKGESLTAVADAIREKTGSTDTYTPGEMAEAIRGITGEEDLDAVLAEQDRLIEEIKTALDRKAAAATEDLDAVLAEQAALIEEIKAELAGKAATSFEDWTITYVDGTVEEKRVAIA